MRLEEALARWEALGLDLDSMLVTGFMRVGSTMHRGACDATLSHRTVQLESCAELLGLTGCEHCLYSLEALQDSVARWQFDSGTPVDSAFMAALVLERQRDEIALLGRELTRGEFAHGVLELLELRRTLVVPSRFGVLEPLLELVRSELEALELELVEALRSQADPVVAGGRFLVVFDGWHAWRQQQSTLAGRLLLGARVSARWGVQQVVAVVAGMGAEERGWIESSDGGVLELEPGDEPTAIWEAAQVLHAGGGVYASMSAALRAARVL